MSVRYYHKTSEHSGYSNGPIFELARIAWPWLVVLLFVSAVIGTLQGNAGSAFLAVAMGFGAWLGSKRR